MSDKPEDDATLVQFSRHRPASHHRHCPRGLRAFIRPLADAFISIGRLDERFDLQAAPAVVIMALVFGFYQFYRRRELSLEAKDASQASREASQRADEMARLVSFGHALTRSRTSTRCAPPPARTSRCCCPAGACG